jgi:hypothetical protein
MYAAGGRAAQQRDDSVMAAGDENVVTRLADRAIELNEGAIEYDGAPTGCSVASQPAASEVWIPQTDDRRMTNEVLEVVALNDPGAAHG